MWPYLIHDSSCGCVTCTPSTNLCYAGPNLPNTGIQNNDTLSLALQKIDNLITTGGGGNQDLQTVLNNGGYAEVDAGNSYVEIFSGTADDRNFKIEIGNGSESSIISSSNSGVFMTAQGTSDRSTLEFNNGIFGLEYANSPGSSTMLNFEAPSINSTLKFPAPSVAGTYTLATTDEVNTIDLQKVINVGGSADVVNGLGYNRFSLSDESAYLGSVSSDLTYATGVNLEDGSLFINQQYLTNRTDLTFQSPIENTILNLPAKTVAGTYTLATTDDINFQTVVNNGSIATVDYAGFFAIKLDGTPDILTSVSPFGVSVSSSGNTVYYNSTSISYKGKLNYFPNKLHNGGYTIITTPSSSYTVSTLPTGQLNDIAVVTDAVTPTYLGVLTGGGSVVTPVWHNGTIWVAR